MKQSSGFALIPAEVLAIGNGYAIAVYAAIAQHADREGIAWPSLDRIAEMTGWSRPTVVKAVKMLEESGVLQKERRELSGFKQSNRYRLTHHRKTASTRMETSLPTMEATLPTLETSFTQDGNDVDVGRQPRFHEQEPIEQEPREQDTPKPRAKRTRRRVGELTPEQQARFDRWYEDYPRKVAPARAEAAWATIDPDDDMTDRMIAKVREWADSDEWTKEGRRFCPHPASWLNGKRWKDGPPARQQPSSPMTVYQGGRSESSVKDAFAEIRRRRGIEPTSTDSDIIETTARRTS